MKISSIYSQAVGLDKSTKALNDHANIRLACEHKRPVKRMRRERAIRSKDGYTLLYASHVAPVQPAKVEVVKPAQTEVKRRVINHTEYVFRDPITGKVTQRAKIGSMPHLYR